MYAHLAGCLVQAEVGCESVGVGGVQIGDVGRNGRHVLEWAASRSGMWGVMDAMC